MLFQLGRSGEYTDAQFPRTILRASLDKKKLRDQEASYLQQIEREQQRSDELLHAISPDGAVRELKFTNEVQPRRYDDVAVMFCDIVSLTAYCEQNPPEKVVGVL